MRFREKVELVIKESWLLNDPFDVWWHKVCMVMRTDELYSDKETNQVDGYDVVVTTLVQAIIECDVQATIHLYLKGMFNFMKGRKVLLTASASLSAAIAVEESKRQKVLEPVIDLLLQCIDIAAILEGNDVLDRCTQYGEAFLHCAALIVDVMRIIHSNYACRCMALLNLLMADEKPILLMRLKDEKKLESLIQDIKALELPFDCEMRFGAFLSFQKRIFGTEIRFDPVSFLELELQQIHEYGSATVDSLSALIFNSGDFCGLSRSKSCLVAVQAFLRIGLRETISWFTFAIYKYMPDIIDLLGNEKECFFRDLAFQFGTSSELTQCLSGEKRQGLNEIMSLSDLDDLTSARPLKWCWIPGFDVEIQKVLSNKYSNAVTCTYFAMIALSALGKIEIPSEPVIDSVRFNEREPAMEDVTEVMVLNPLDVALSILSKHIIPSWIRTFRTASELQNILVRMVTLYPILAHTVIISLGSSKIDLSHSKSALQTDFVPSSHGHTAMLIMGLIRSINPFWHDALNLSTQASLNEMFFDFKENSLVRLCIQVDVFPTRFPVPDLYVHCLNCAVKGDLRLSLLKHCLVELDTDYAISISLWFFENVVYRVAKNDEWFESDMIVSFGGCGDMARENIAWTIAFILCSYGSPELIRQMLEDEARYHQETLIRKGYTYATELGHLYGTILYKCSRQKELNSAFRTFFKQTFHSVKKEPTWTVIGPQIMFYKSLLAEVAAIPRDTFVRTAFDLYYELLFASALKILLIPRDLLSILELDSVSGTLLYVWLAERDISND